MCLLWVWFSIIYNVRVRVSKAWDTIYMGGGYGACIGAQLRVSKAWEGMGRHATHMPTTHMSTTHMPTIHTQTLH